MDLIKNAVGAVGDKKTRSQAKGSLPAVLVFTRQLSDFITFSQEG